MDALIEKTLTKQNESATGTGTYKIIATKSNFHTSEYILTVQQESDVTARESHQTLLPRWHITDICRLQVKVVHRAI